MDVQTVVANVLTFNTNTFVRPALQGFSDADLLKRPSEACNPIGWLFWHQPRVEDLILSHISGRPQTWVAYTWHAQFGRPADPRDSGFGHSLEQVMALQEGTCDSTPFSLLPCRVNSYRLTWRKEEISPVERNRIFAGR
jgi:hypothetical protein